MVKNILVSSAPGGSGSNPEGGEGRGDDEVEKGPSNGDGLNTGMTLDGSTKLSGRFGQPPGSAKSTPPNSLNSDDEGTLDRGWDMERGERLTYKGES